MCRSMRAAAATVCEIGTARGGAEPLLPPDKNRYYEFTEAPRLRGIATITSSVVARVVGARTLVASAVAAAAVAAVAVAVVGVVVVTNHEFSCLSMIICSRLKAVSNKSMLPLNHAAATSLAMRAVRYCKSPSIIHCLRLPFNFSLKCIDAKNLLYFQIIFFRRNLKYFRRGSLGVGGG